MRNENCVICRKHDGLESAPPGGYIYEDEHWMACHADVKWGSAGDVIHRGEATLFRLLRNDLRKGVSEKGLKFLARDDMCNEEDAIALAEKLRQTIK
jgi:hypothetical protein